MKPAVAFRKAAQLLEADECLGCCVALILATNDLKRALRLVRDDLAALIGRELAPMENPYGYWWPVNGPEHERVTPRLIALELAALLCEENDRLSKKRKR